MSLHYRNCFSYNPNFQKLDECEKYLSLMTGDNNSLIAKTVSPFTKPAWLSKIKETKYMVKQDIITVRIVLCLNKPTLSIVNCQLSIFMRFTQFLFSILWFLIWILMIQTSKALSKAKLSFDKTVLVFKDSFLFCRFNFRLWL